jgi:hypothetical protein
MARAREPGPSTTPLPRSTPSTSPATRAPGRAPVADCTSVAARLLWSQRSLTPIPLWAGDQASDWEMWSLFQISRQMALAVDRIVYSQADHRFCDVDSPRPIQLEQEEVR